MIGQAPTQEDQDLLMEVLVASNLAEKAVAYHKHGKLGDVIGEIREECKSTRDAALLAFDFHQALKESSESSSVRDAVHAAVLLHELASKDDEGKQ